MKLIFTISAMLSLLLPSVYAQHLKSNTGHEKNPYYSNNDTKHLNVPDAEWKKILPPALYATARKQATEAPFFR